MADAGARGGEPPLEPGFRFADLRFVSDAFTDGRFRLLAVVDDFTRGCLTLDADTSLSGTRGMREPDAVIARRGRQGTIVSDNGTEFTSPAILSWCQRTAIQWHHITPGKPMRAICAHLNATPRKCLAWRTPTEAFRAEIMNLRWSTFSQRPLNSQRRRSVAPLQSWNVALFFQRVRPEWCRCNRQSGSINEPVSDPWLGHDETRVRGVVAKLLPQLADVDPQILAVVEMGRSPYRLEDHLPGDKAPAVAGEHPEEVELPRSQM